MESELSNQKTTVRLIDKLPSVSQNFWQHNVYQIRQDARRMPNISDLALFVEAAAKEVNDPVYGSKVKQDANKVKTRRGEQSFVVQWIKKTTHTIKLVLQGIIRPVSCAMVSILCLNVSSLGI
jgi:hypothetical protein